MTFYRRNLPHLQPAGAEYFITFRLANSLPKKAIERLKKERELLFNEYSQGDNDKSHREVNRRIFKKYEEQLVKNNRGPTWLKDAPIAKIVEGAIHFRDNQEYELYAYCIMPNHVHLVFKHLTNKVKQEPDEYPVTKILASLKKYTSKHCNIALNRTGNAFWQDESYDHVIRDTEELRRIIFYTLHDPVKSGFVDDWQDWEHSYCKSEFRDLS
ncbi:transposase [Gracilimonas sp.]|uniref:transposase n=1 Tax=Gracilimonas sp. TaxID=1974203 RepID=UPI002871640D|nr:transposase [Gracilimonas sp.]